MKLDPDALMSALLDTLLDEGPGQHGDAREILVSLARIAGNVGLPLPRIPADDRLDRIVNQRGVSYVAFALGLMVAAIDTLPTGKTPSSHRNIRTMWARDTFLVACQRLALALEGRLVL